MSDPVIRLDTSKKFSTVHGDRTPEDAHYRVHFFQSELPFDSQGVLVPDDGKSAPYFGTSPDGKQVSYMPLYTPRMREVLAAKLARFKAGKPVVIDQVTVHDDEDVKEKAAEEVNIMSWLRGEINYEPHMIFTACAVRYGKRHQTLRSVVEDLILDEGVLPESDVAPHLMRLIDTPASAPGVK